MNVQPSLYEVKQFVTRTFLELGIPEGTLVIKETIFIDSGRCMACGYRADGLKALWCVDEGIVQFSDTEGNVLRTVDLLEEKLPLLAAV